MYVWGAREGQIELYIRTKNYSIFLFILEKKKNKKIFILASLLFELIQTICGINIASYKILIRINIKIIERERQSFDYKLKKK